MKIDWFDKLRHYLQVIAFCLTISAIQAAFQPDRPYEVPLLYSVCIGTFTWAIIDFGRHLYPSSRLTGWPADGGAMALPAIGIIGGYLAGTWVSDRYFGWSSWDGVQGERLRISILITAVSGIAVTYYFYSRNRSALLTAQRDEAHQRATEARLKLLETQLEPHMLFNTLANLRALIATDPPQATRMLDRLIAYLRATLAASRASTHALGAEFDRLQDYLELMAVRMGPRLRYTLDLPAELRELPVPPLLLQAIVENSIKHGLEPKIGGGSIGVRASRDGAALVLEVTDTGVGLKDAALGAPGGSGFGMRQVRDRLAATYGSAASMDFGPGPQGGARTVIHLPVGGTAA